MCSRKAQSDEKWEPQGRYYKLEDLLYLTVKVEQKYPQNRVFFLPTPGKLFYIQIMNNRLKLNIQPLSAVAVPISYYIPLQCFVMLCS